MAENIKMDDLDPSKKIPDAHLKYVCKYRRGIATCRYIMFKNTAFYCVKNIPHIRKLIDEDHKKKGLTAPSDNCGGL